jgi:Animal haem peroxidase
MGGDDRKKGVTRRRFLASTTTGAAATVLGAHTALARGAPTAPADTRLPGAKVAPAAGTIRHGDAAISELAARAHATLGVAAETSPFGRMFPSLPAHSPTDQAIANLAPTILAPRPNLNPDNTSLEAGFTYVGQIIDHDITFDQVSNLLGTNDPNGLNSTNSARYDLDSMYGGGPGVSPQFYDPADPKKLLVARPNGVDDVPRDSEGRAIIADPRNDQHKIIVQLHVVFMKFHNAIVDLLRSQGTAEETVFAEAQKMVRWHYQWIVVTQWLPRLTGDAVSAILSTDSNGHPVVNTQFYQPAFGNAFMPVEFSVAAFRFAHSMVRETYRIDNTTRVVGIFARLLGGSPVTPSNSILWGNFFTIPGSTISPQFAKKIDAKMALPLGNLPRSVAGDNLVVALAERNLRRAKALGLPSGQQVAALMGEQVLTNAQLGISDPGFGGEAPLWFYILKEAEIINAGRRLGPVGGRIIAEVLLGIMAADPNSYFNAAPTFSPVPPLASSPGRFGIADLLLFAGAPI